MTDLPDLSISDADFFLRVYRHDGPLPRDQWTIDLSFLGPEITKHFPEFADQTAAMLIEMGLLTYHRRDDTLSLTERGRAVAPHLSTIAELRSQAMAEAAYYGHEPDDEEDGEPSPS